MSNYKEIVQEANSLIEKHSYIEALRKLEEYSDSDNAMYNYLLSRAYFGIDRVKRALKYAKKAFEIENKSQLFVGWYAILLYNLGDYSKMKEVIQQIDLEYENHLFTFYISVKLLLDENKVAEAQSLFTKYQNHDINNPLLLELSILLSIENFDPLTNIIRDIELAASISLVKSYALKSYAYLKNNEYEQAQSMYNKIVQVNPAYIELEKISMELDGLQQVHQVSNKKATNNQNIKINQNVDNSDLNDSIQELDRLIGLKSVKEEIKKITSFISYNQKRNKAMNLENDNNQSYHFSFYGNPGTGKTTVARILADIFYKLGVIPENKLVEVDRSDLVGQFIGSATAMTQEVVKSALGGVLFVDEAYALYRSEGNSNDFGQEAIDVLIKAMEDHRNELIVIFAGYTEEMQTLLKANPGLKDRINLHVHFPDYAESELEDIAELIASDNHYTLTEEAILAFNKKINQERVTENFSNARTVRNIIEQAIREKAFRQIQEDQDIVNYTTLDAIDFGVNIESLFAEDVDDLLAELDQFIGLENVKQKITTLINYVIAEKRRNGGELSLNAINLNMFFLGNPGTGKTTIARLLSKILSAIGLLKKGHLIEVTRDDLVGGYIGQTGAKTLNKIKEAYGGVLFIDEAYSLASGGENDFGKEAINTLVKEMEDSRDKLVIIMAGYSEEMNQLLNVNSGLKSRIPHQIIFPDYESAELLEIFIQIVQDNGFELTDSAKVIMKDKFQEIYAKKDSSFGNGREVRNLFEQIKLKQSTRIVSSNLSEDLQVITEDDVLV